MWLSFSIGLYLGVRRSQHVLAGQVQRRGHRVAVSEIGGMFGNPNDMALHFVMMTPLVSVWASPRRVSSGALIVYFGSAGLFVAANMVSYSRGGFIGMLACPRPCSHGSSDANIGSMSRSPRSVSAASYYRRRPGQLWPSNVLDLYSRAR